MKSNKKILLNDDQKKYALEQTLLGKTNQSICNHLGFSLMTFWRLRQEDPLFDKELLRLRAESSHNLVDELRNIYSDCSTLVDVQRARGESENIRWMASKRMPEVYGESINLNINHHVDLTKVLEAASSRTIPFIDMKQAIPIQGLDQENAAEGRLERGVMTENETEITETKENE